MRLLVITQAVDLRDSNLGFFHRWIEEFASHSEQVIVVCLRKGEHALPDNVEVISLGERGKLMRTLSLCAISFGRRKEYDAVFAHMSPEFVVAAGWLWRLLGKKTALWYVHKSVTVWLRIATFFVHHIFTASDESFRLETKKKTIIGHGIDTDFFTPDPAVRREKHILSVGRLSDSKQHDLVITAAVLAKRKLLIAGEGPERQNLEALAAFLHSDVTFLGGLSQEELRDEYRKAAFLIHASVTGSVDKVVLEALACDCAVITTASVFREFPVHVVEESPEAIAEALTHPSLSFDRVNLIREKYSLPVMIQKLLSLYA